MAVCAPLVIDDVKPMPTVRGRDLESAEHRQRLATALEAARQEFTGEIERGRGGRAALVRFSDRVDELLRDIVPIAQAHTDEPVAVCALGGYGRRALCLHSDIDLLVLFGGRIGRAEERFLRTLLHPLWDLKLTVGHHVRELTDFQRLETDNPEFLLALLDARFLAGDRALFDRLDVFFHSSSDQSYPLILDALLLLTEQRHAQFNATLYQLEPDVKDAPGALRDVSATRTIARLAGAKRFGNGTSGPDRLQGAEEFFLRVRSILHLETGRNLNLLSHALQEKVAERLGYSGAQPRQRVEALMSDYFRHARTVAHALARTRRAARPAGPPTPPRSLGDNLMLVAEGMTFADTSKAAAEPASWLQAFEAAAAHNVPVSDEALALIEREQEVGGYSPQEFLPTERDRQRLLQFLRPRPGLSARLSEMHDCGLLDGIFPEFRAISCRVIRDFYHKYTVDEHTLLTIGNLERLLDQTTLSGERFGPVLRELRAPELLVLSLLFHDVGKWKDENHAEEGARMAQTMLDRLQIVGDARQTVEFLIRNHLQMSRVAFRRDTEDPEVVRQFARLFGTEEHLKMLCLMTLADVGAVSPDTLTPWKEELLWRFYVDTYNHMTLGYGDEVIDRNQAVLAALQASRPDDISETEMARFLEGLPRRYLTVFDPESIYRHVRLSRDIHPDELHLSLERKTDVWELTVVTLDKPYLFSNICGVLSYFGMDILRGHAITSLSGLVLDVFQFTDREAFFQLNLEARPQFNRLLSDVVAGRIDVTSLLRGKERSVLYRRGPRRMAPVIYFDNDYSQRYTVLELVADDALGLLHRISRVISRHGCDVDLVLISTEGHKAIDVFHITKGAAKLSEPAQLALKEDLERMLEEGYETH